MESIHLDLLNEQDLGALSEIINEAGKIIITCHKSPDGDALGASLACAEWLRTKGKEPLIVVPDMFPDFLRWLPGVEKIRRYDKHKEELDKAFEEADTVFCLDFNATDRVGLMQKTLEECKAKKVLIDHHLEPTVEAEVSISHPEMSATCELLFRIIWQMGDYDAMSKHCAVAIYCGMMTDTGGFTYNSTRSEIFYIIGQLLAKGINKDKIFRNVYNVYSDWCIRLRGYVMYQKLNVLHDEHATYYAITKKDMARCHFKKGDAEGLVNEPLRIKGIRLSISLREDTETPGLVWVSIRSVDHYYCDELARTFFNGGGHANAAGGKLFGGVQEAERITREAIKAFAEKYN